MDPIDGPIAVQPPRQTTPTTQTNTKRRTRRRQTLFHLLIKLIFLVSIVLSVSVSLRFVIFSSTTINNATGTQTLQNNELLSHQVPVLSDNEKGGLHPLTTDTAAATATTTSRTAKQPQQQQLQQHRATTTIIRTNANKSTNTSTNSKPRILLAIFTVLDVPTERQRRHLIRNTYLDFDRVHNTTTPHRSCSLTQYSATDYKKYRDNCQLVYTFVCAPKRWNSNATNTKASMSSSSPITIDPSLFPDYQHEKDLLFVKTSYWNDDKNDNITTTTTTDTDTDTDDNAHRVEMIYQWYRYCQSIHLFDKYDDKPISPTQAVNDIHKRMEIHYIAFTDTQVAIFPNRFWNDNALWNSSIHNKHINNNNNNNHNGGGDGTVTTANAVYAGISVPKSDCVDKKCPSLLGDVVMRRFVLVSMDLAKNIVQAIGTNNNNNNNKSTKMPLLQPKEAPEVVVANLIHSYKKSQQQQQQQQQQSPVVIVRNISLSGLVSKTSSRGLVGDYLQVWDRYKDSLTYYDPEEQSSPYPRILLGIFTMDSPTETQRRDVIRKTYLRYYRKSTKSPHRICSLSEYKAELDPKRQPQAPVNALNDNNNNKIQTVGDDTNTPTTSYYCQMIYTFVMGSNPNGPKELVDEVHASLPLTVANPPPHLINETDIVHLNIQENMKEGKSQTWLKYATSVTLDGIAKDGDATTTTTTTTMTTMNTLPLDYIGKIDGDTLLYPHLFLKEVFQKLPHKYSPDNKPYNIRIYGGDYRIRPSTNTLNLGPVYMGGHFYFMSVDLAAYIVSPNCNRTAVAVYSEDQSIGNFVHTHPLPIRRIRVTTRLFEHPLKRMDRMRTLWRKQVGQPQQQQPGQKKNGKNNNKNKK